MSLTVKCETKLAGTNEEIKKAVIQLVPEWSDVVKTGENLQYKMYDGQVGSDAFLVIPRGSHMNPYGDLAFIRNGENITIMADHHNDLYARADALKTKKLKAKTPEQKAKYEDISDDPLADLINSRVIFNRADEQFGAQVIVQSKDPYAPLVFDVDMSAAEYKRFQREVLTF